MHQTVAVVLQVDALAGRVGGEQDPDRRLVGRRLEQLLDPVPLVEVHAAVEYRDLVAATVATGHQLLVQPALCVAVLGEHDHPGTVAQHVIEPVEEDGEFAVVTVLCALRPRRHGRQQG